MVFLLIITKFLFLRLYSIHKIRGWTKLECSRTPNKKYTWLHSPYLQNITLCKETLLCCAKNFNLLSPDIQQGDPKSFKVEESYAEQRFQSSPWYQGGGERSKSFSFLRIILQKMIEKLAFQGYAESLMTLNFTTKAFNTIRERVSEWLSERRNYQFFKLWTTALIQNKLFNAQIYNSQN